MKPSINYQDYLTITQLSLFMLLLKGSFVQSIRLSLHFHLTNAVQEFAIMNTILKE